MLYALCWQDQNPYSIFMIYSIFILLTVSARNIVNSDEICSSGGRVRKAYRILVGNLVRALIVVNILTPILLTWKIG
jgi:hypothetical protein